MLRRRMPEAEACLVHQPQRTLLPEQILSLRFSVMYLSDVALLGDGWSDGLMEGVSFWGGGISRLMILRTV